MFWNGIISKGMEQALTQMSVSISSVLDELKGVNKESVNKTEINQLLLTKKYVPNFSLSNIFSSCDACYAVFLYFTRLK